MGVGPRSLCAGSVTGRREAESFLGARDYELHRDGGEEEAHDARHDADPGLPQTFDEPLADAEYEPAQKRGEHDRSMDDHLLRDRSSLGGEDHDGRNGARSGEHRHCEWRERGILLRLAFQDLRTALLGASLGVEHIHGDEPQDQAAGYAEGGERDAEELEDERAADREGDEDQGGRDARAPRCPGALGRRFAPRHDQITRNDRDRIHDEEDRRESDEGEFGERWHGPNWWRRPLGATPGQELLRDDLRFRDELRLRGELPLLDELCLRDELRRFGTFAPFFRASERPIAIACFRLFTLPPWPFLPRRSVPCLRRRIALSTLLLAPRPYLRPLDLRRPFLAAMSISREEYSRHRPVQAGYRAERFHPAAGSCDRCDHGRATEIDGRNGVLASHPLQPLDDAPGRSDC